MGGDGVVSDADLEICLAVLRSLTTEDRVAKPEYKVSSPRVPAVRNRALKFCRREIVQDRRYRALRVALQPFLDDLNGNNIADARLQKQQQVSCSIGRFTRSRLPCSERAFGAVSASFERRRRKTSSMTARLLKKPGIPSFLYTCAAMSGPDLACVPGCGRSESVCGMSSRGA